MGPIILLTAGLEPTEKGIPQLHSYQNYGQALSRAGGVPVIVCDGRADGLEDLADLAQGLCLSGGVDVAPERYGQRRHTASWEIDLWRDELEWKLCDLFTARGKPILGICRGLQLLNVYFGGSLVQDLSAQRGISHPNHSTHPVEAAEGSWLRSVFGPSFPVNSYHHQAIDRLGEGLVVTATACGGQVAEGIEHRTLPVQAVQWHPERMTGADRCDPEGPDMGAYFERFCRQCEQGR